ncbi:M23/M56 family metallopeptidase [Flammeovirga sp. SJP92]|uniref:M23/M56 family metallopeptidase n=1 Tax=Flammeovirga sp. SJP92 TaxID=1775430 RepID=UPI0007886178|nr:M23/M56 family metallopeptidase [Flammeovirga sp. SJP92]KXX66696.1 hypothetical protein AVL50_31125 [Flammeovirga sp. SJP92]
MPISLALPLMDFDIQSPVKYLISDLEKVGFGDTFEPVSSGSKVYKSTLEFTEFIDYVYWIGFVVSFVLLVANTVQLFHKIGSAHKVYSADYSIYRGDVNAVFSCFKWILIPQEHIYNETDDPIIKHELAHVRSGHSYDLLFTELFIVFTWFNPFVFLFRKLLRSVHEFQADEQVLSESIKKSDYLELMLNNLLVQHQFSLTSSFKSSIIENRIEMITKNKSSFFNVGKYLFLLPVMFMVLFAFAEIKGSTPSISPIKKGSYDKIVMPFSKNKHGIDMVASSGTDILATGSGEVLKSSFDKNWGNVVVIDHGNGYQTRYAHMNDIMVFKGQTVSSGQVIGHVGSTGKSNNKPHLNYQVRKNGKKVDPETYFTK